MHLLTINQVEGFYFLMKNKNLSIRQAIKLIEEEFTGSNKEMIPKYLSLAIYVRSLGNVVKDFYPTYTFFQKKEAELSSDRVKRDINILASKLKLKNIEIKSKEGIKFHEESENVSEYLMHYYNQYMESLSLSGYVDLTNIKAEEELDVDREMTQISKEYLRQKQEIEESKRKYEELMRNINSKPKPLPAPTSEAPSPTLRIEEMSPSAELPSKKL